MSRDVVLDIFIATLNEQWGKVRAANAEAQAKGLKVSAKARDLENQAKGICKAGEAFGFSPAQLLK